MLGAKAANVQLAVPPTLAAGDWSVDSEGDGEGSSGEFPLSLHRPSDHTLSGSSADSAAFVPGGSIGLLISSCIWLHHTWS